MQYGVSPLLSWLFQLVSWCRTHPRTSPEFLSMLNHQNIQQGTFSFFLISSLLQDWWRNTSVASGPFQPEQQEYGRRQGRWITGIQSQWEGSLSGKHKIHFWLVVQITILKNMSSTMGRIFPDMKRTIKVMWNHQPVLYSTGRLDGNRPWLWICWSCERVDPSFDFDWLTQKLQNLVDVTSVADHLPSICHLSLL